MINKLFLALTFLIMITSCDVRTNSPDFNEVERLEKEVHALKDKAQETEKELKKLREIEALYKYQVTETPYINMLSSRILYDIQNEDDESLNKHTHEKLHFEEIDGDIYAITPGYERKITYNNDDQSLETWFIEGVSFEQNGNVAEVTVRPDYVDENNESVKEDRYFKLYFAKIKEDWLLQEISL